MKKFILLILAIFVSGVMFAQSNSWGDWGDWGDWGSCSANCENISTAKVIGDLNTTIIEQLGDENCNYLWVEGYSNKNTEVYQKGDKNESVIEIIGNNNNTDIDQIGDENKVGICCSSPGWNKNWNCDNWGIYFGRSDRYGLMINGSENYTKIYQEGNKNAAEVNINGCNGGYNNDTQIHQYGCKHSAEEYIYGSGNYTYTMQH